MKKRLLFASMLALASASSFALEAGEYVYTPDGRYKIADATNLFKGDITNFNGFTAVNEGGDVATMFNTANDLSVGNYFQATNNLASTDGMQIKLSGLMAGSSYIVSLKMKGPASTPLLSTHNGDCGHMASRNVWTNKVYVASVPTGLSLKDDEVTEYSKPVTIASEWTTYNFAITDVSSANDYYLQFVGMSSEVSIADIQIVVADQVADLRKKENVQKLLDAYTRCWEWDDEVLIEYGIIGNGDDSGAYEKLNSITDDSSQDDLEGALEIVTATIDNFAQANMDDWLLGAQDKFPIGGQLKSQSTIGCWTGIPNGRVFRDPNAYYDLGHYVGGGFWGGANGGTVGFTQTVNLEPGVYVFSVDAKGVLRNSSKNCWCENPGLQACQGVMYIVNEVADTIATTKYYNISPSDYTSNVLVAKVETAGQYEIGMKSYAMPGCESVAFGGALYVKDVNLYAKTASEYTKAELTYIENVKNQIQTGRANLTTATNNISSNEYYWGKAALQTCVDEVTPKIAEYEAMSDATIVATFNDDYQSSLTEETGYLEKDVYQNATKEIIAANKAFKALNDTLVSVEVAIKASEELLANRVYAASSEGEQLKKAIATAKTTFEDLKTKEYSVENAKTAVDAVVALSDANEVYKNGVSTDKITSLADFDFSNGAVLKDDVDYEETPGTATIEGTVGTMEISSFRKVNTANASTSYELGIDANGEKEFSEVLRVGKGTGSVALDLGDMGTNILKISMDWWFGRLTKRVVGFYLDDENNEHVSGLVFCPYNLSEGSPYDPCGIMAVKGDKFYAAMGSSSQYDVAFYTDNNKTTVTLYLDYGAKAAQLVTTCKNGETQTSWVAFDAERAIKTLQIYSDYDINARRCWLDNVKVEKITAGKPTGVDEVESADSNVVKPTKKVVDGQVVIEKGDVTVNVAGVQVK